MVYKISFQLIFYAIVILLCFWLFNNVNAWVGIASFTLLLIFLLNKLINFLKQQTK